MKPKGGKEGGSTEPVRTPVRVKIKRLEAGGKTSTGGRKLKRKRGDDCVLKTGQKRIIDFFIKCATAELNRESSTNISQGACKSPLLGAPDSSSHPMSSSVEADPKPEESGGG